MARLLLIAGSLALFLAALAPAGAWYVDRRMSKDVILITPGDPSMLEMEKMMWEKGQPVAKIYGEVIDKPIRVVRPDPRDIIVPEEDPSLTLMVANSPRHPLQVQTVWVGVKYGSPSAVFGGLVLIVLGNWWKRRKRASTVSAA